jgi:hypothetical protein
MPLDRTLVVASLITAAITITTVPTDATAITKLECDLDMFHCLSLYRRVPAVACIEAHSLCLTVVLPENGSWVSRGPGNGGSRQYPNAK